MKTIALDPRIFGFIVGTRAMLAAGAGLLLAERLPPLQRRAVGAALVAVGVVTTIPAVIAVRRGFTSSTRAAGVYRDEQLIGATRFPRKGDDHFE
jgi:hypothetical protein